MPSSSATRPPPASATPRPPGHSCPTPEAKAETWDRIVGDDTLPNAMQRALLTGFAHHSQGELLTPYVHRYFEEIADVWEQRSSEVAQVIAMLLFPTWGAAIGPDTVAAADAFLADDPVPSALRRLILEGRADVLRAIRARAVDTRA